MLRCWTKTPDYYSTRAYILRSLHAESAKAGIEIPYPHVDVAFGTNGKSDRISFKGYGEKCIQLILTTCRAVMHLSYMIPKIILQQ